MLAAACSAATIARAYLSSNIFTANASSFALFVIFSSGLGQIVCLDSTSVVILPYDRQDFFSERVPEPAHALLQARSQSGRGPERRQIRLLSAHSEPWAVSGSAHPSHRKWRWRWPELTRRLGIRRRQPMGCPCDRGGRSRSWAHR